MKVAIIGDSNSIFVKQYIEYVLPDEDVVLLSERPVNKYYSDFYESHNINVIPLYGGCRKWMRHIPILRSRIVSYLWAKEAIGKMGGVDVVHIHALNQTRGFIGQCLRNKARNVIISIWGSELLGRNQRYLKSLTCYYKMADHITMESDKMIATFKEVYGSSFDKKITNTVLFLGIYDYMDSISKIHSRDNLCKSFGIEHTNKMTVFVGHNGRDVQQHFAITDELKKLPAEIKDKIILVYTMTYGTPNEEYLKALKQNAKDTGCEVVFVEGYMSEDNIAKLRLICDVLIHAQPTDAASASVRECMYGGAIVLNGSWLRYDFIPNYDERVVEYAQLDEIPGLISDIVCNKDKYQKMVQLNKCNRDGAPSSSEITESWKKILTAE